MQQTAKDVAKEAGMSSDEEDEDEGDIRKVLPGEAAAAAAAAEAATANAALDTSVSPCSLPHLAFVLYSQF